MSDSSVPEPRLDYLTGYTPEVLAQVRQLLADDRLADHLRARYPTCHGMRGEKALYDYAVALKNRHLRSSPPLSKVVYDPRIHAIDNALGRHSRISRIQGGRLKAKFEIRVADVFRRVPQEFLDMILIHELAHFKQADHNKAFYQLCRHMAPEYHQWEFDLRLYLTCRELVGEVYGTSG